MSISLRPALQALLVAGALLAAQDALAIIGRPMTPGSYAGVARRTTRRAVVATAAVTTAVIYSLPSGCSSVSVNGIGYQNCGGTYYRPYYQGTDLVYSVETP